MLLIGSKALDQYLDLNRVTHDWDIFMSNPEFTRFNNTYLNNLIKEYPNSYLYEIDKEIFEIKVQNQFEPSDHLIFNTDYELKVSTPIGDCFVPDIQTVYDIKASTALVIDEPKHKYDVELIEKKFTIVKDTYLFKVRLNETQKRFEKSKKTKYDFFHKYHIPEYIYHDNLHEIIASLLDLKIPTYKRITTGDVTIAEDLFNKLTYEQKISLMVEESLVLSLERWFIPQMIENGINYRLIDIFYNNNEASATYSILKHCCITGLKGEAEYITNFARQNFFVIEKQWRIAKEMIMKKGGFPPSFFNQLFNLRERYKKGENIVTA